MTVVIDTNVVLTMFKPAHPHHLIFVAWTQRSFAWAVTTEILFEYEEIMTRLDSTHYASTALSTITMIGSMQQGSLQRISPTYRFHQIIGDPDDDKFADCAIAAEADYIITEDRHFQALIGSGYRPQPITPAEFIGRHLIA
jgi:uncharacterized protein